MLTRFTIKRDFRIIVRCLSDKSSEDGGTPEKNSKDVSNKNADASKDKIQQLLKSMLAEPKISESEYRAKFATAPEQRWRNKPRREDIQVETEKIEESITKAAGEVAQALGGDVKQTEAELLAKVLGKVNRTTTNLSDLIIGMKVDRTKDTEESVTSETRGQQVKRLMDKSNTESQRVRYTQRKAQLATPVRERKTMPQATAVDIFAGQPLGIFQPSEPNYGTKLEMWEHLKQRELTLATSQPPANYFQKMILWTEQGKVWKFPINNEQGMESEENVPFSEHIFLDTHLEGWCPKKGPIRHFMELVCVGLSKNPFYTIEEKRDHIMWYKEFFQSKKDLLTEVGAWSDTQPNEKASA